MSNVVDYIKNSVVTCYSVYPMIVKEMNEEEIMNVCVNMLMDVCDKYGTGNRLFKVFPYGSRFKNLDRKNLIIFMNHNFEKCTGIRNKFRKLDWEEYIKIPEKNWYNNGDGSSNDTNPYDYIDNQIIDVVCRIIYVLSDNYDLSKVFNLYEPGYWDVCEWDEVIDGMFDWFEVLFMKQEVFEQRYK